MPSLTRITKTVWKAQRADADAALKKLITEHRLHDADIASKLHVHANTVARWRAGGVTPHAAHVKVLLGWVAQLEAKVARSSEKAA